MPDRFPLRKISKWWSKIAGGIGGIVTALVSAGLISAGQGESVVALFTSVDSLLGLIPGVIAAGVAVWSSFSTAKDGEKQVTPVADPRDSVGRRLVKEP